MIIKKRRLFIYIFWDKELNIFGLIYFISGEIVGFSQNTNALEKWTLTAHLRAPVSANFRTMLELGVLRKKMLYKQPSQEKVKR